MARMIALVTLVLGGCLMPATNVHTTGVVATGEQLAVVDDVKVWTTTSKEKVAETEYKDSNGQTIGTAAVYQDKTQTHTMKIWYPVQGTQQLADEDFFKISGEQQALATTEALRERGHTWRNRGIGMMIGGAVGMIAGYVIGNPTVETLLSTVGGLTLAGGYYATYWGAKAMDPETHAVDRSIAERAALQYNTQLGHTVGMGMTRHF